MRTLTMLLMVIVSAGSADAAKPRLCPGGRFLLQSSPPLAGATAIVIDRPTVAVADGCEAHRARFKATRKATRVKVRWPSCTGVTGRARLDATIEAPDCTTMVGTFTAGSTVAVQALRSSCGDGVYDPVGGEECDAGTGCTAGDACSPTTCHCAAVPCSTAAPTIPALQILAVNATPTSFATFAVQPPGSSDWYIAEQSGRIEIVRNGAVLPTPFLDIQQAMGNLGPLGDERGLLSLAFHPDYAQNGRFFTMATPADGADGSYAPSNADAVVEWQRDTQNPDVALATKVRDIVVLPVSDTNHNGGTIVFGPDQRLYVGTGDGGGGCESAKPGAVQDTTRLFGKILRLDVDAAPPFAAAGNPFTDDPRVYHYGLRNPFRFNFDTATGDLFIGDVGQDSYEEVSVAPGNAPGQNFGWPAFEGAVQGTCGSNPLGGPSPYTPPIVSIEHELVSSPFPDYESVIGGRVYRGAAIPALQGVYLFADFFGAELGALRYCDGQVYGPVAVPLSQIPAPDGLGAISSFVQGNDGELYVTYGAPTRIGRIAPQ